MTTNRAIAWIKKPFQMAGEAWSAFSDWTSQEYPGVSQLPWVCEIKDDMVALHWPRLLGPVIGLFPSLPEPLGDAVWVSSELMSGDVRVGDVLRLGTDGKYRAIAEPA